MASYEGSNGAVKLLSGSGTATAVAQVRSWSITIARDTVEDTSMGDSYRTYKKGLQNWSGTMDIVYDDTTSAEVNEAISPDTDAVVTGDFYPDVSVTATKFSGTLIITSFAVTASYDGLVTASVAFQGTGALSAATYSA